MTEMVERKAARITDLGWRDRVGVIAVEIIVGAALTTNRDFRNRILSYIVDGARDEGVDYRPYMSVLLHFVTKENKRRLDVFVESAFEGRRQQIWQK